MQSIIGRASGAQDAQAGVGHSSGKEDTRKFEEIEAYAAKALQRYSGAYLNDLPEFGKDASVEHVGDTLYEILSDRLRANGVSLLRLEIGENPLRTYIISSYL